MDIRNRKELHRAATSLAGHPAGKKTVLIYAGVSCALSLVLILVDLLLSNQVASTGGLGNMGLRSALVTAQTILPVARILFMLCMTLGYQVAMLDLLRHRSTNPRTLQEGFRRLGPLVRLTVIQVLIYLGIGFAAAYLSTYIFLLLPFSNRFMELFEPLLTSANMLSGAITMDEGTTLALAEAMLPMLWITLLLFLILFLPIYYRYRMATYCLCEDPVPGAIAALRGSRNMMRRNRLALFRVDLGLWWYYVLETLAVALSMGGDLLLLAGVDLHWAVVNILFPLLSLAAQFCLYYFTLNRVTLTYAAAYEALRPQPQPVKGVPLGNIFDLYRESNEYRESQEK